VKYLELSIQQIEAMKKKLQTFLVPKRGNEEQEAREQILIFLPPRYHLLMKLNSSQNSIIVKIRTDFWRVLICVDQWLEQHIS